MRKVTNANPLIMNFMKPEVRNVDSKDTITVMYDPQTQITYLMGGGGGRVSRGTRSYDGYRETVEKDSGTSYYRHNDAERWTDD